MEGVGHVSAAQRTTDGVGEDEIVALLPDVRSGYVPVGVLPLALHLERIDSLRRKVDRARLRAVLGSANYQPGSVGWTQATAPRLRPP